MHGLTIRWSLTGGPEGVEDALRAYVEATSHGRYSGRKDLRFKTWRMRDGEWFEGCYVFETPVHEKRSSANSERTPPGHRAPRLSARLPC
jgi:hypothetical protein